MFISHLRNTKSFQMAMALGSCLFVWMVASGTMAFSSSPSEGQRSAQEGQAISFAQAIAFVHAKKFKPARDVFSRLAAKGDPNAMYHLGAMFHSGAGGAQNLVEAVSWYGRAADAGVPEAQLALGSLAYKGKGTPKDLARALELFSDAAEAGLIAAQYNLAMMHTAGLAHSKEHGTGKQRPKAYKWFTIVLQQLNDPKEREAVEGGRSFLKKEMTHLEVAEGEAMAKSWLEAKAGAKSKPKSQKETAK